MNLFKLSLFIFVLLILVGCSDPYPPKAQIQMSKLEAESGRPVSFYGKAMFFDENLEQYLAKYVDDGNALMSIDEKKDLSLKFDFPEVPPLIKTAKTLIDKMKGIDAKWDNMVKEKSKPYLDSIKLLSKDLEALETKQNEIELYLKPARDKVENIKKQIGEVENEIRTICEQAIDAFNDSILEENLPLRKLNQGQGVFGHSAIKAQQCQESKYSITWDNRRGDGLCYSIQLPYAELKNTKSATTYLELFKKYLPLSQKMGQRSFWQTNVNDHSLYAELSRSEQELKQEEIRAQNKFGMTYELTQQISELKLKIQREQSNIETLKNDYNKANFTRLYLGDSTNDYFSNVGKYLNAVKSFIFSKADKTIEISNDNSFDMAGGAQFLLVEGNIGGKGAMASYNKKDSHCYFFVPLNVENKKKDILEINDSEHLYYNMGYNIMKEEFLDIKPFNNILARIRNSNKK